MEKQMKITLQEAMETGITYCWITSDTMIFFNISNLHTVAQLVEALCYKSEGHGFDSLWFQGHNPSGRTMALESTQPLTEMSTRNIFWGKGGRCVGLKTFPPSRADCLEISELQLPGNLWACPSLYWDCCILYLKAEVSIETLQSFKQTLRHTINDCMCTELQK
jgi:hypothetical protein